MEYECLRILKELEKKIKYLKIVKIRSVKASSRQVLTWRMLSSATEATTQSSEGFQAKSETLEVWPPWMNSSSGGPSSASSGDCAHNHLFSNSISKLGHEPSNVCNGGGNGMVLHPASCKVHEAGLAWTRHSLKKPVSV